MKLLLIAVVLSSLQPDVAAAQGRSAGARRIETYQSVAIDANGSLVITTSDRKTIVVKKEGEQTAFAGPIVSADRTAVGAQAEFANCCTSYDVPLQLVIYAQGKVHRFTGIGLAIFQWHFATGGTRVAFGEQTVHSACSTHYELRDIQSERLIDSADIPESCGQDPEPDVVKVPTWVAELIAAGKRG